MDPLEAASRRDLGHVPRRAGGPVDDGRGVLRAPPRRRRADRRAHGAGRGVRSRLGRASRTRGSFTQDLARIVRVRGPGTSCRRFHPRSWRSRRGCPATSTTSVAGRARPPSPSPSWARTARSGRPRSASTSCGPARPRTAPDRRCGTGPAASCFSTGSSTTTTGSPIGSRCAGRCARRRCARQRPGSSGARRPTGAGGASSRPGCTRSSRCTCAATPSTTPSSPRPSPASSGSWCARTACAASRRASPRCGTRPSP